MIRISTSDHNMILTEAQLAHPRECCGLLIGERGAEKCITNIIASPNMSDDPEHAFEVDPALHLRVQRDARENGKAVIGVYHSHPRGTAAPSATDLALAIEPGWIWLIVGAGQNHRDLDCRAYSFQDDRFVTESLEVGPA